MGAKARNRVTSDSVVFDGRKTAMATLDVVIAKLRLEQLALKKQLGQTTHQLREAEKAKRDILFLPLHEEIVIRPRGVVT